LSTRRNTRTLIAECLSWKVLISADLNEKRGTYYVTFKVTQVPCQMSTQCTR